MKLTEEEREQIRKDARIIWITLFICFVVIIATLI